MHRRVAHMAKSSDSRRGEVLLSSGPLSRVAVRAASSHSEVLIDRSPFLTHLSVLATQAHGLC